MRNHHKGLMAQALEDGEFTRRPTIGEDGVEVTLTGGEVEESVNGNMLPHVKFALNAGHPFSLEIYMEPEKGILEKIHPLDGPLDGDLPQPYSAWTDMREWPDPNWGDESPGLLENGDVFHIIVVLLENSQMFYWKVEWQTDRSAAPSSPASPLCPSSPCTAA